MSAVLASRRAMPVSHAVYCAAHAELHGLEDVRRLAEDDRQPLSYDALLCIFSKKQVKCHTFCEDY